MSATHYSEDDLTLYYYAEGRHRAAIERHLQVCTSCAALYHEITGTLAMIAAPEVPPRGDQYGLEVWQRIRHKLPEQEGAIFKGLASWFRWDRLALAGGAAILLLAAFVAGRTWREPGAPTTTATVANPSNPTNPSPANSGDDVRRRILLTSVADHLDRSERVLTDIMNVSDHEDISAQQGWAEDLLTAGRLYRQDALDAGERSLAAVLDDIERNLLEIVHSPSKISAADLEQIRRRIDAAALLFKVRVMSDELRDRESAPVSRPDPRTSTQRIS